VLTTIGMTEVGGWHGLQARINDPAMFHMVKPLTDPTCPGSECSSGYSWRAASTGRWTRCWCSEFFAAKDLNEGRKGAVFTASESPHTRGAYSAGPGREGALLQADIAQDLAYRGTPQEPDATRAAGLTVAGVAAALMGHLSATYNSIATLSTRDFYLKWRPDATQEQQIWAGRLAVFCVFVLGAAWAPVIAHFKLLWIYLQSIGVYIVMPFVGCSSWACCGSASTQRACGHRC